MSIASVMFDWIVIIMIGFSIYRAHAIKKRKRRLERLESLVKREKAKIKKLQSKQSGRKKRG